MLVLAFLLPGLCYSDPYFFGNLCLNYITWGHCVIFVLAFMFCGPFSFFPQVKVS